MTHQPSSPRRRPTARSRLIKHAVTAAVFAEVFLIAIALSEAAYVHWQWNKSAEVAELGAVLAVAQAARDTGVRPVSSDCATQTSVDGLTGVAGTALAEPRWFGALVNRLKAELRHIAPEHVTLTLSGDGPCLTADVELAGLRLDFILLDVIAAKFASIPLPTRAAAATAEEVLILKSVA